MIRPNLDNILVRRENFEMKSDTAVISFATDKNAPLFGVVLSVGPGIFTQHGDRITPRFERGDIVMIAPTANLVPVPLNGRELAWLVREPEILATVDESDVQKKRS